MILNIIMEFIDEEDLLSRAEAILKTEPRWIELPEFGQAVFVGDTHGDLDASKRVLDKYLSDNNKIVFLGDYVDRGPYSRENLLFLLSQKIDYPENVFLLMGNHEGFALKEFYPANFWLRLSSQEKNRYGSLLLNLSLVVTSKNGIIALHGALPDISELNQINQIILGDDKWDQITWGDFQEEGEDNLGGYRGRPQFGQEYFRRVMSKLGKRVLIRSHQPNCREVIYDKRCLTIFTSYAYLPERTVALLNLEKKEIRDSDDLSIKII